jgi:chromosomal replication initiator protein
MAEKLSRMEFHTWFKKVRLTEISGSAALLACPTEMNKNWLETKYKGIILSNFKAVSDDIDRLFFKVDLTLADSVPANPALFEKQNKPRKLPNQPQVKLAPGLESRIIHAKYSLGNFIVGESNRLAHAACMAVAESDKHKKYNPLFIYGGVGLGKTHLLQGTANEILRRKPNALVVYTTSERFTNEIVKAIRERKVEPFRKKYRRVEALIIDDVQFFEGKEQTQIELFNTFNDLYEFNRQIIFSSDRPPSELKGISDRLRSRMGWGLSVDVQMPDYETRLAIVQAKAKEKGLMLPHDVEEFIAANIRRHLREVENIINQIVAELELSKIQPTVQSVGRVFRKLNPLDPLANSDEARRGYLKGSQDIITFVSEFFQIPATDLLGKSRKQEIVYPRQICWYLCKEILNMSYDAIGGDFGGKNHTTIMHGIRKIKKQITENGATTRHVHALRKDLGVS